MRSRRTLRHSQRGAATLLVALVLMMALTIVTLSVARTQLVEQRIAGRTQLQAVDQLDDVADHGKDRDDE